MAFLVSILVIIYMFIAGGHAERVAVFLINNIGRFMWVILIVGGLWYGGPYLPAGSFKWIFLALGVLWMLGGFVFLHVVWHGIVGDIFHARRQAAVGALGVLIGGAMIWFPEVPAAPFKVHRETVLARKAMEEAQVAQAPKETKAK